MNQRTIHLVEDKPADAELALRALKTSNIVNELMVARDGVEALDYLRSAALLPAVILLDPKLPKVDGVEVSKMVRATERLKRLPAVILTSSRKEQNVIKSYDLGANSYVRKPVAFARFTDAVKQPGWYWLLLNEPPPQERSAL